MNPSSKDRADTRSDFIDAAWELFSRRGYERTTINAIIDKVGLSKGAFYHYFSSKEDVLDAVVERMIDEIGRQVEPLPRDDTLSAADKLNRFFTAIRSWKLANFDMVMEIARVVYSDGNIILRHKMNKRGVEQLSPVLASIIEQGGREGTFDVGDPGEAAVLVLHLANTMGETQAQLLLELADRPENVDLITRRINVYIATLERILGAREGSIETVGRDVVEKFARAFQAGNEQ